MSSNIVDDGDNVVVGVGIDICVRNDSCACDDQGADVVVTSRPSGEPVNRDAGGVHSWGPPSSCPSGQASDGCRTGPCTHDRRFQCGPRGLTANLAANRNASAKAWSNTGARSHSLRRAVMAGSAMAWTELRSASPAGRAHLGWRDRPLRAAGPRRRPTASQVRAP
jgi:hypothetical protein